jgi:hypothetical protein
LLEVRRAARAERGDRGDDVRVLRGRATRQRRAAPTDGGIFGDLFHSLRALVR